MQYRALEDLVAKLAELPDLDPHTVRVVSGLVADSDAELTTELQMQKQKQAELKGRDFGA